MPVVAHIRNAHSPPSGAALILTCVCARVCARRRRRRRRVDQVGTVQLRATAMATAMAMAMAMAIWYERGDERQGDTRCDEVWAGDDVKMRHHTALSKGSSRLSIIDWVNAPRQAETSTRCIGGTKQVPNTAGFVPVLQGSFQGLPVQRSSLCLGRL